MKRTPLYERHLQDGGKIVAFAGYDMPIQFTSIMEEHHHVRSQVGVFDVSHMGEVFVIGKDATVFLDKILTNAIYKMEENSCMYTIMCYENGTCVDDLLVYKYTNHRYLLVINASNDEKDVAWIREQSKSYDLDIQHVSDQFGELAVQGPKAEDLLTHIFGDIIKSIQFFNFKELYYQDIPLIISRTGYTGEDGFEVFMPKEDTLKVYDLLFDQNSFDLKPIGLGARDTLRFEAALPLYGHEISDQINPIEARLDPFIDLTKDFIGREALQRTKENEQRSTLVGFMLDDKGIPREGYDILDEHENVIGHVTTGYMLDTYSHGIGLGYVPKAISTLQSKIYIRIRKNIVPATVIKRKFYDKKYKK